MPGIGDLVANLTVNRQGWQKGLGGAKQSLGSWVGGVAKLLAPVAGLVAGVWGTSKALSSYKTQIDAERKLQAVLKATEGAAGLSAKEIATYAGELQGLTNVGDEATIDAAALLATFKEVKGDEFKDALAVMQDMAAVLGTDVKAGAIQVGKALNNPIMGMSALADAGVSFTDQQKEQIRALQEAGDIAGAQRVILEELQGEFGGAAAALADPFVQAGNAVGDVAEMFGSLLKPSIDVVSKLVASGAGAVSGWTDEFRAWGTEAAMWLQLGIDALGNIWSTITTLAQPAVSWLMDGLSTLFGFVSDGSMSFTDMGIEAVVWLSHIGDMLQVLGVQSALYFVQLGNDAAYFFTDQAPAYLTWFADNWTDIMFTAVDYTLTLFINLGKNIRALWDGVLDFIAGNGFNVDWTPLLDGAVSTIKELPDIPERAATEFEKQLAGQIEGMTNDLGRSMETQRAELAGFISSERAKFESPEVAGFAPGVVPGADDGGGGASGKGEVKTSQASALRGSSEALQTILFSRKTGEQKELEKTNALMAKSVSLQQQMVDQQPEPAGAF